MDSSVVTRPLERARFEVMPFPRSLEEAAQLPEKVRLTVTCSPKHGPDRSVEVAAQLRDMSHQVTVHIAARMVRDRDHLHTILAGTAEAGADGLFLIGGDADPQRGTYGMRTMWPPRCALTPTPSWRGSHDTVRTASPFLR
jgi:methylenetetrahydrofolate reductase (NADPH)